jgi:hypothetical protein
MFKNVKTEIIKTAETPNCDKQQGRHFESGLLKNKRGAGEQA